MWESSQEVLSANSVDYDFIRLHWFIISISKRKCSKPMSITINQLTTRTRAVIERLARLWESSVRATHDFLTEENIQCLKPFVAQSLHDIPILCDAVDSQGAILGFMGVEKNKLEMLFISPEARGRGIGRQLVTYAIESLHVILVDVNEQNPQAVGFYRHMGFVVFKRSHVDGQGNPFPLLHMKIENSIFCGDKT
jgi:putative acetyltransferase